MPLFKGYIFFKVLIMSFNQRNFSKIKSFFFQSIQIYIILWNRKSNCDYGLNIIETGIGIEMFEPLVCTAL